MTIERRRRRMEDCGFMTIDWKLVVPQVLHDTVLVPNGVQFGALLSNSVGCRFTVAGVAPATWHPRSPEPVCLLCALGRCASYAFMQQSDV